MSDPGVKVQNHDASFYCTVGPSVDGGQEVAVHQRCYDRRQLVTHRDHQLEALKMRRRRRAGQWETEFDALGPVARQFHLKLLSMPVKTSRHLGRLLALVRLYGRKEVLTAIPYGVYDLTNNEAWVSVGIDHDTAEFAVAAIERWWRKMGRQRFPKARKLYITVDGGGSNGSRSRLWKAALQKLANRTGLTLSVSHFPPGTSKWNKIEHRLFCHITQNWREMRPSKIDVSSNLGYLIRLARGRLTLVWNHLYSEG